MNIERPMPGYKYVCYRPESEFLTGQEEYSQSCECLVKSSTLCGPLPHPPTSTLHPPDVIHTISVSWPFPF